MGWCRAQPARQTNAAARKKNLTPQVRNGAVDRPSLIGGLIFSGIGFVAFVFGRKQARIKTAMFGVALMIYPYFIYDVVLLYGIGIILTVCVFTFTD